VGQVRTTRAKLVVTADHLDADIEHLPLVVANRLVGQPLAVPRDIRLGDTPDGEPAIWWQMPPSLDQYGIRHDWGSGGTAEQAFWRFVDLADVEDPERFVAFAQRFGTLGLWPYKTPMGKRVFGINYWVPSTVDGIQTPCRYSEPLGADEYLQIRQAGLEMIRYEPIAEWRRWAGWLRTAIEIAYQLRLGRLGTRQQWQALDVDFSFQKDSLQQRADLAQYVQQRLVHWSGLSPVFHWGVDGPRLALTLGGENTVQMPRSSFQIHWPPNSLYPALIAQLIALITAGKPIATCMKCGKVHTRSRKARSDQPVYCSDECRHEAIKETKRKSADEARTRTGNVLNKPQTTATHLVADEDT
jgi:hypothetical protein